MQEYHPDTVRQFNDLYDGGEGSFIPWGDITGFLKTNLQ